MNSFDLGLDDLKLGAEASTPMFTESTRVQAAMRFDFARRLAR
jgi:hypothetical protein